MDYHYGRRSSTIKGTPAPFSPLPPLAEGAQTFKFDDVSLDLQLDRALSAIVTDDVSSLLSTLANGLKVSSLFDIVSHGDVLPAAPQASQGSRSSHSRYSLASNATSKDTLLDHSEVTSAQFASLSRALRGHDTRPQQEYRHGPVVKAGLLHVACVHKAVRCTKFIANLGAVLDAPESYRGDSALHIAARMGSLSLVDIICSAGADVQVKNVLKNTPLHVAAGSGHVEVVLYLLHVGAEHLAKNRFGDTPWDCAVKCGSAKASICADILFSHHCQLKEA